VALLGKLDAGSDHHLEMPPFTCRLAKMFARPDLGACRKFVRPDRACQRFSAGSVRKAMILDKVSANHYGRKLCYGRLHPCAELMRAYFAGDDWRTASRLGGSSGMSSMSRRIGSESGGRWRNPPPIRCGGCGVLPACRGGPPLCVPRQDQWSLWPSCLQQYVTERRT
jgi:hypothetical protein